MKQLFALPTISVLSLLATAGVLLHDTYADKLSMRVLAPPTVAAHADAGASHLSSGVDHTHVERVSLQSIHQMSRNQPRRDELRQYLMQRSVFRNGYSPDLV